LPVPLCRETILNIKPYVPGKPIEEVERELGIRGVIKLASNENPMGPSPKALEALQRSLARINLYPDGSCYNLKNKLASLWGWPPEGIVVGNGADEVIKLVAEAFLNPGEEAIMADPTFSEYEFATLLMGGRAVKVPCQDWQHSLEDMAERITPNTKLVFICNPNNPTGTIVRGEDLDSFLTRVPARVLVVLDEAYAEYVEDPQYREGIDYLRRGAKNLVVLRTFSKIYGLAGLRVGYGLTSPEVAAALNRVREPFNVNLLAQEAALAALEDQEHRDKSRALNREGKEYLYREFRSLGLEYVPSQTNFIFVDVKRDGRQIFQELLKRGIIVRTGDIFGYPTFLRITVGTLEQNRRLVEALKEILA